MDRTKDVRTKAINNMDIDDVWTEAALCGMRKWACWVLSAMRLAGLGWVGFANVHSFIRIIRIRILESIRIL